MTESFPRQEARTRRFSLGVPRAFRVSPDGTRVVFLRTKGGADPVTCLWVLDVDHGAERLVADPRTLGPYFEGTDEDDLPAQERARRERVRESAGGIVAYATDQAVTVAVFALSGHVYAVPLTGGDPLVRPVATRTPALDPRPDPAGRRLAYVCDGALRVADLAGDAADRAVADPHGAPGVTFGLPEFIAAEEMDRHRGYWWAPDGSALLVARVDETPVNRWHIADPAHPDRVPAEVAYPAAGTPNADVTLHLARLDGRTVPVQTDPAAFPYLVSAGWQDGHDPLVVVQSRDQRAMRILGVDAASGATTVLHEDTDPAWLEIVPGVPAWTADGRIVWTRDEADTDTRRLVLLAPGRSPEPVTPPGVQVRGVLDVDGDTVLFQASGPDPASVDLWRYEPSGPHLHRVGADGGVQAGTGAGGTMLTSRRALDADGVTVTVSRSGSWPSVSVPSLAEQPSLPAPDPVLFRAGPREIQTAVLFPSWHRPGEGRLPVLLDPYGGPHAQRVLRARGAYLVPQWFAEQGFAVVIADGRGTPARGPAWERAVAGDLAGPVLDDQMSALAAAADRFPDLDTGRVAIRGWSFGGYLAALAVLRRPDVFHAAIAGAPVTDWRLYDTHYTERYLGLPGANAEAYDRSSLIILAERSVVSPRPLLLIHGLADDNVVVAHTLRLSAALLAAGYPHEVLPLTGITHMASQETVAENLLLLQLDFLRRSLGGVASVT
ncbi:MAG TPA: prolyl oligopeptidase family serine peptidase [Streptosporangiaceae bacterium]|nr:prolyl oligopeptidase family serine peptidase [Streptosporangiaceae bacterium]